MNHTLVKVLTDLIVENIQLKKGMIGTIVSVYKNAYAVEFPHNLEVVTLHSDQIEPYAMANKHEPFIPRNHNTKPR